MRSRRAARIIGAILVALGTIAYGAVIFLPVRERPFAIIFGGALINRPASF